MQNRENALRQWLQNTLKQNQVALLPLTGDASFRRYYRLHDSKKNYIVMDAPPEKEPLEPFINIGKLLQQNEVLTPTVHAFDKQQGFALLDDFGDTLLLNKLDSLTKSITTQPSTNQPEVDLLYRAALNTLNHLQRCHQNKLTPLPVFDKMHMQNELEIFKIWFLGSYLNLQLTPAESNLVNETCDWLVDEISQQPYVFIHRDYHSRNIMILDESNGLPDEYKLGIIDFQDAMIGPITYDLVSLLKDCYIQWPTEQVIDWLTLFYENCEQAQQLSLPEFKRAFDLCGLQRHLKVLGVFCRLFLRDNKPGYLADLPLTRHYVMACLESYPELHSFYNFMEQRGQLP